jgi:hypothetical protein
MSYPKIYRDLFQNDGAGDKLNTSILPAASTTAVGAARIASSAEATAGTDTTKIMTPALTKQAIDKFAPVKTVNGAGPDESGDIPLGLHAVATSGSYLDLLNKPSIPATPKAYVTQTWSSGKSWYRVWSDGFVEQGGFVNSPYGQVVTITLNRPLNTTNYTILLGPVGGSESSVRVQPSNETKTSFQTARYYSGNGKGSGSLYWEALGY